MGRSTRPRTSLSIACGRGIAHRAAHGFGAAAKKAIATLFVVGRGQALSLIRRCPQSGRRCRWPACRSLAAPVVTSTKHDLLSRRTSSRVANLTFKVFLG